MDYNNDLAKDQVFLKDQSLIREIVKLADLKKTDTVLEIGAGTGNITSEIAKIGCKVIAFEIDKKFKNKLSNLPRNVEVHYDKAEIPKRFRGKIVSNPPFSVIEPLLNDLILTGYKKVILVVPLKIVTKINSGVFGSFFRADIKITINKDNFYPIPKTNSVVVDLVKLDNKNLDVYLRQFVYLHQTQKVKNSLMEGLVKYNKITKNEAREIVKTKKIKDSILEKLPNNKVYDLIETKFKS